MNLYLYRCEFKFNLISDTFFKPLTIKYFKVPIFRLFHLFYSKHNRPYLPIFSLPFGPGMPFQLFEMHMLTITGRPKNVSAGQYIILYYRVIIIKEKMFSGYARKLESFPCNNLI